MPFPSSNIRGGRPIEDVFRDARNMFVGGVAVLTVCEDAGTPRGVTVSSLTWVSSRPFLILVCLHLRSRLLPFVLAKKQFNLNVLATSQRATAQQFADCGIDRFASVGWHAAENGAPIIDGSICILQCDVAETTWGGDHEVILASVRRVDTSPGEPLICYNRDYHGLRVLR